MQKTIFILAGFRHHASEPQYRWMQNFFKRKGFAVRVPSIEWNHRTMTEWKEDFVEYYKQHKTKTNYVLGFSFGAMIAFMSAPELKPNKLFLCSLSPFFKEDLHTLFPSWKKEVGKKRLRDFRNISANKLAREIAIPTVVFCGEQEAMRYPTLFERCKKTQQKLKKAKLVMVVKAPHVIDHPGYVQAIKAEFL
jgi:esterase/lipase